MIQAIPYIGEPATLPIVAIQTERQIRTRNGFDEQSLSELAASIREVGVMEPLIVRPAKEQGKYIVIAGERRLLASSMAQLAEVPVLIREATDAEAATMQAIENLQRENLALADTADGVGQLLQHYKSPKAVAKALGKSPAWVSKHLSVTRVCASVRAILNEGLTQDAEIVLGLDKIARMKATDAFPTLNALVRDVEAGTITREKVRLALQRLKGPGPAQEDDNNDDAGEAGDGTASQQVLYVDVTLALTQSQLDKLQQLGGKTWLIAQLDKA